MSGPRASELVLVAALAGAAAACAASQRIRDVAWRAGGDGRVLVAEFHRPGEASDAFARDVLADASVRAALTDVEYRRYDATGGLGKEEAERLGVYDYPTFIVFRRDGMPVAALEGAPPPRQLADWLLRKQVPALDGADVQRRLERGRTAARLILAARWYADRRRYRDAAALYDEALAAAAFPAALRERVEWEAVLARSAGGSRADLARRAGEHAVRYIAGPTAASALEVALLSGGLHGDEANQLLARCVQAIGEHPTRTGALSYLLELTDEDTEPEALTRARNRVHGVLRSLDIAIPPDSHYDDYVAAVGELAALGADKCSAFAGRATVVVVRIEVPESGGVPTRIEPASDAAPELIECLRAAMATVRMPPVPEGTSPVVSVPVRFDSVAFPVGQSPKTGD